MAWSVPRRDDRHVSRRAQNDELLVQIGARLRQLRSSAGLTQVRLAELVGLQPNSISLMESGSVAPTLTTLANLARGLGVRPMDMLDFGTAPPPAPAPADADEAELLNGFRTLDANNRALVRGLLRALARAPSPT